MTVPDKPKIICMCGSSRFIQEMAVLGWTLEKEGYIVVGLHLLPSWYMDVPDHGAEFEGCADHFNELHLRKIDLCDIVFIVNINGYIGHDTIREMRYAKRLDKPIVFLEGMSEKEREGLYEDPRTVGKLPHECGTEKRGRDTDP
jgi:hypothetical protein